MGHVVSPAGLYGATARPFPRIPDRLMAIDTVGGNGHGRVLLQKRIDNGFSGKAGDHPHIPSHPNSRRPDKSDGANHKMSYALLEGLQVLELGGFISAPYCGKLLADMGAQVIKIEEPGHRRSV